MVFYNKIPTGIPIIDQVWGGFYKGRTYLVTGPSESGKTVLTFQFLQKGLELGEKSVLITDTRSEDLILMSEALGFTLSEEIENQNLVLIKYPDDLDIRLSLNPESLQYVIDELITYLEELGAERVAFDPIRPLVSVFNLELVREAIGKLAYTLENIRTTSLLTIGKPASVSANLILQILEEISTGVIRLDRKVMKGQPVELRMYLKGTMGHITTDRPIRYQIIPGKGIVPAEEVKVEEVEAAPAPVEERREEEPVAPPRPEIRRAPVPPVAEVPEEREEPSGVYPFPVFRETLRNTATVYAQRNLPFSVLAMNIVREPGSILEESPDIRKMALAVKFNLRDSDKASYEGDRILVLLPGTDKKGAQIVARRLVQSIRNLLLNGEAARPDTGVHVNVAIKTFPDDSRNPDELLARAIAEVEEAKRATLGA